MTTKYETCLNEFRDASAAVRRAFGAVAEARELQIIANSQHQAASQAHAKAVERLDHADHALTQARAVSSVVAPAPKTYVSPSADDIRRIGEAEDAVDATLAADAHMDPAQPLGGRVTQADIDAIAPERDFEFDHAEEQVKAREGQTIDAQANGLGIG